MKLNVKNILAVISVIAAVLFFNSQKKELIEAVILIKSSSPVWVTIGILLSIVYVGMQGYVYVKSFAAAGGNISYAMGVKIFLKRNFIGVFLPAGGFTALAFFRGETEKEGISKQTSDIASFIYTFVSLASLIFLGIVVFIYLAIAHSDQSYIKTIIIIGITLFFITWCIFSLKNEGLLFRTFEKYIPSGLNFYRKLADYKFNKFDFIKSLFLAHIIEALGVLHLYIAMIAIGCSPSLYACLIVYTVATFFYCFSPFMKGVGVVELSMTLLLVQFGYTEFQAISIALLYRLFEFWLPLILGMFSFFVHRDNIIIRLLPSLLIFGMGIINVLSSFTPVIKSRAHYLSSFISGQTVDIFNSAALLSGVLLIICSVFLIKGFRSAWYCAMVLCLLSFIVNLVKGLDYEEAGFALLVITILVYSSKHYFVSGKTFLSKIDLSQIGCLIAVSMCYGLLGFYFLQVEFKSSFSFISAFINTIKILCISPTNEFIPASTLGYCFLYTLKILGIVCIGLLVYKLIKGHSLKKGVQENDIVLAQELLSRYGRSPVDYFKIYGDKNLFFSSEGTGFIAYKVSMGFAVVLEGPVCEDRVDVTVELINSFERYCREKGLKTAYYRVDENQLQIYSALGKKYFPIGEEAIVDVDSFNLEGKKRKSLRNALNSLEKKGLSCCFHEAPLSNGLVQKLQLVSDNWLKDLNRTERSFSQGVFDAEKIKNCHVITLEDKEGMILAFLNIIPNYVSREATYDLIRKLENAPGGNMDALLIKFLEYCKLEGYSKLNLGLAPFSGLENKNGKLERFINFLYQRNKYFRSSKGLREFKEKFDPLWVGKYLVYSTDFDLLTAPLFIDKVMKHT